MTIPEQLVDAQKKLDAANAHVANCARMEMAGQIAGGYGFSLADMEDPEAVKRAILDADPAKLPDVVRLLPQTVGMKPDRRAAYLKERGIIA